MQTPDKHIYGEIDYTEWIGRSRTTTDLITEAPLNALAALLDRETPVRIVPPLWHWIYFLSPARMKDIGNDGHSGSDDLLPPSPLPRRMRAGGSFTFSRLLETGEQAERVSTIESVQTKAGASGQLLFVTIRHEITGNHGALISEIESLVYREESKAGNKPTTRGPAELTAEFTRTLFPNSMFLFKYSAVTHNAHRIHYDRPYCMEREAYPGLVVHGPLTATLLLELLSEQVPGCSVKEFNYSAVAPLFDTGSFCLCGRIDEATASLWALDNNGALAMKAEARVSAA